MDSCEKIVLLIIFLNILNSQGNTALFISKVIYRVSQKNLMPFQIQISREFHYGTLSIPIGIQGTDRD